MTIGEAIKKLRIKNNIKQLDLANMLYISEKTISSWENNRTIPDINMIYKLSNIFKVSFISLIDSSIKDNNDEISIKIKVEEDLFKNIFNKFNNSKKINTIHQLDTYFYTNNNSWLRLRNEEGKTILNLKEKINNNSYSYEEVQIDNYNSMNNILNKLNYKEIGIIEKNRTTITYNDILINFDELNKIGCFIEFKLLSKEGYEKIIELLNELNIDISMITTKKYIEYLKEDF